MVSLQSCNINSKLILPMVGCGGGVTGTVNQGREEYFTLTLFSIASPKWKIKSRQTVTIFEIHRDTYLDAALTWVLPPLPVIVPP